MTRYIDADKLIAEIDKRLSIFEHGIAYNCWAAFKKIVESLQQEQSEVDLGKEEFVGVAESPLKTFPRVNDFECGGSYRH